MQSYLDLAIDEGGRFACGGGSPPTTTRGFFIEPTVIAGLDNTARVAREEIFGPVLTVIAHDGDDDADPDRQRFAVRAVRHGVLRRSGPRTGPPPPGCGSARSTSTAGCGTPRTRRSAAYKQSGVGREMGLAGFEEYLELKVIATAV